MKKIIFIKLGGSLITDKEKPYKARFNVIDNLSKQISEALNEDKNLSLVIGNGGGSFPHYPAVKYQMKDGIKIDDQKLGFCEVQDAASRLNRIIVRSLLNHNIKALSISPSSMIITKKRKIKKFFIEPIIKALNLGIIPVIYGDIVFDEVLGSAILSTETLLNYLCIRFIKNGLKVNKIIHNGITPGVLDDQGNLIKKINKNSWLKIKKYFTKTKGFDVTGGMLHKVKEALIISSYGIKTLIINGYQHENILKRAILGEKVIGTLIF